MNPNQSLFFEVDFAAAMEKLALSLMIQPEWKELIYYRGVSALDAGYSDFYWKFLEILREQVDPNWVATKEGGQISSAGWSMKLLNSFRHIRTGELSPSNAIKTIGQLAAHQLTMQLPPLSIPPLHAQHKALVVRSFMNTSPFPILKTLAMEPDWQIIFASWNRNLKKPVTEAGIPFFLLEETYRRKYTQIQKKHEKEVINLVAKVDPFFPVKLLSTRLGEDVRYDATSLITKVFTKVRIYTDIYFDLISNVQPNVVILLNEITLQDRLMGLVSTLAGTPSVSIQHGLFIGYVYHKLATDKIIVWGQEPKKFWENIGCLPERIISVGAFAHESWKIKKQYHLQSTTKNTNPRVLFLGQNPAAFISPSMHSKTVSAIFQAIQALPDYYFIVKPHPGENPTPYHLEGERLEGSKNHEILNGGSIEQTILESDLVITVFSTAGLEAMLLERPVLVLNLSHEPPLAPYVSAAELVTSAHLLPQAIQKILDNPEYRRTLVDAGKKYAGAYFGEMDGQAISRAVRTIKKLAIDNARI